MRSAQTPIEARRRTASVSGEAANHLVLRKHHPANASRATEPTDVMGELVGLPATRPLNP
jgi:hypothetical protein